MSSHQDRPFGMKFGPVIRIDILNRKITKLTTTSCIINEVTQILPFAFKFDTVIGNDYMITTMNRLSGSSCIIDFFLFPCSNF